MMQFRAPPIWRCAIAAIVLLQVAFLTGSADAAVLAGGGGYAVTFRDALTDVIEIEKATKVVSLYIFSPRAPRYSPLRTPYSRVHVCHYIVPQSL